MKKILGVLMVLTIAMGMILAGCGSGNNNVASNTGGSGGTASKDKEVSINKKSEVITIEYWHSMSGANGKAFTQVVDDFNAQSDDVQVKEIYQGSYPELLTKINAAGDSKIFPAIVQVSGTERLNLSLVPFFVNMQQFVDEHNFDVKNIEPNVLARYQINGDLYSMPFSASSAVWYINADMFKEAGLDPYNPPTTYSETNKAFKQIKEKTGNYGIAMRPWGWYFEEFLSAQDALYFDNDNGYSGLPTKTLINGEAGQKIFQWFSQMIKDETLKFYGRASADSLAPFLVGQVASIVNSSAGIAEVLADAEFELVTAPLPVPDGVKYSGATIGGNSQYIGAKVTKEEQDAAWKFLVYSVSPEVQAKWSESTGYFPVTVDAKNTESAKAFYKEFPQMYTAVEINANTEPTPSHRGPLGLNSQENRDTTDKAIEDVFQGGDPQKALDEAARVINESLKNKN